jgi:hypothetical protein
MIVALAGMGTALTLYPVLKRQNEGRALGFVGSRALAHHGRHVTQFVLKNCFFMLMILKF